MNGLAGWKREALSGATGRSGQAGAGEAGAGKLAAWGGRTTKVCAGPALGSSTNTESMTFPAGVATASSHLHLVAHRGVEKAAGAHLSALERDGAARIAVLMEITPNVALEIEADSRFQVTFRSEFCRSACKPKEGCGAAGTLAAGWGDAGTATDPRDLSKR